MSRRILYIVDSLERSGASRQLAQLTAGLPRDEFNVHVCALSHGGVVADELRAAGAAVTIAGRRWKWDPRTFVELRRHIRRLRPDLVQTWHFAANAYGRAAAWQAGVRQVVAVERRLERWKMWPEWLLDRRLARRTACMVANSETVRDYCLRHKVVAPRWEVIPEAVAPLPPSDLSREHVLEMLSLPPGARLIGVIGSLEPIDRYKDLIWAADILKIVHDNSHLLIVGDGRPRARLERFRRCVRIEDRVHFLGRRDDVSQLLPHFVQLWLPGDEQGMSAVMLEAMAASVPVVASDTASHRTVIAHGETGLLAAVGDRVGLAKQAHRLLENPELARSLGEASRRRVLEAFTPARMVERYSGLYQELLEV